MNVISGATPVSQSALLLQQAEQRFRRGEMAAAEVLIDRLLLMAPEDANALHLLGLLRYREKNPAAAAALFRRSLAARPKQPNVQLNLGHVLREEGQTDEAATAYRAAIKLKPDLAEAHFALGDVLHGTGHLAEAEQSYRKLLRLLPGHGPAQLRLSAVLIDAKRPAEAERVARRALGETSDRKLIADLEQNLALALRMQNRIADSVAAYERAQASDPALIQLEHRRACMLQQLGRFDEAVALFRRVLAREPLNLAAHSDYNHLLYCLRRDSEFLCSYDSAAAQAGRDSSLLLAKAAFLLKAERHEEAEEIYRGILARDPGDASARHGIAVTLAKMKRFEESLGVLETALLRDPGNVNLRGDAAAVLAQMREPRKAAAMAMEGLAVQPHDQICLALLGTAWRMMDDARAEPHNGYFSLIRAFDLEPPEGFADMAAFNRELNACLDRLHPPTREFIDQSLRGGTQTQNNILGAGHELVERLQRRISEAVGRYVAEIGSGEDHPFLGRRTRDFAFTGSWSSRLRDCGFHVNHLHPGGWISSCYYIAVPDAVQDEQARQGWIKFGEPSYDVGLAEPVARAIRPAPGRLVLFPSYSWHGTVPFRDAASRTTIAFDVIPA